jgi:hypothetical protein
LAELTFGFSSGPRFLKVVCMSFPDCVLVFSLPSHI